MSGVSTISIEDDNKNTGKGEVGGREGGEYTSRRMSIYCRIDLSWPFKV